MSSIPKSAPGAQLFPECDPKPVRLMAARGRRRLVFAATFACQYVTALRSSGWTVTAVAP